MLLAFITVWLPVFALACVVVWIRRIPLRRSVDARAAGFYLGIVAVESLAYASQLLGCLLIAVPAKPWIWAVISTAVGSVVALDTLIFVFSGMRLQRSLLSFADALHEFADKLPWRAALAALVSVVLLLTYASVRGLADAALCSDAALKGACFLAMGCVLTWGTQRARNTLPMVLTYEWNNRILAWQGAWVRGAWRKRTAANDAQLLDGRGMPSLFTSAQERVEHVDPAYPMLRKSLGFVGKKHFELRVEPNEKPHVVMLFLESFRGADTGVLGAPHHQSVTPVFDALSREGVLWNNFYANGTITSRAMTAALFGVLPDFRQYSSQASKSPPAMSGLPQIFAQQGYLPGFFSDGPLEWENKREFFLNHGFPLFHGAPSIKSAYPEVPNSVWNFSDEYLMRFHADWLARQDAKGQPTFSTLLTVSTHYPWVVPQDAPEPDVDLDKNTQYYRFLRTIMYTDKCIGLYMDLLRERGLDKKTVFLILGDHGQQVDANNQVSWSGHYTTDGVRVPLLLLAPGRVQPMVIKEIASQVDLLPTVIDMLDIRATHHAVGSSLVRACDTRQAISIHPWSPGMLANSFGNFRYVYNFDAQKSALYDLSRDPGEKRDIAALHPDLVRTQHSQVALLRRSLDQLVTERRMAPESAKDYLKFPRLVDAPAAFPMSLQACSARAATLMSTFGTGTVSQEELVEFGITLVVSTARNLTDTQRLEFAQLLFFRANLVHMGEMTDAESARLCDLEEQLQCDLEKPDAPDWMRKMAQSVRQLARAPKYPELRGIP